MLTLYVFNYCVLKAAILPDLTFVCLFINVIMFCILSNLLMDKAIHKIYY